MMPPREALDVALTAPVAPLAQLRRWVADVLARLAEDVLHDGHARGPRRLLLHEVEGGARLRVEVQDAGPDHLPAPGRSTAGPTRGRGLVLMDVLSGHRWGVHVSSGAKTVWAEIPLS